jgi:trans-aconitate methyltransferase
MVERANTPEKADLGTSAEATTLTWSPTTYEAISRHFQVRNAQAVLSLHTFNGSETVLDVGSGDGLVTATHIAPRVPLGRVVGLDVSLNMLAHARGKYPVSSFQNVSFIEGDACNLDAALETAVGVPRQFNLVFSNATLHWLIENQTQSDSKHLAALGGMNRCLSPDGAVLLAFVGQGALEGLVAASLEVTRSPQWSSYFDGFRFPELYSAERYAELVAQAGLKPVHVEIVDQVMSLSSASELARWFQVSMRSFMARLAALDMPAQLDFATQAVQRYVGAGDLEREVSVVYKDLVVQAVKGNVG